MANNFRISLVCAQAAVDAITALIDSGTAAILEIYDGTQPADPGVAVTSQVKLATLTFSSTAFGAAADLNPGARATANSITPDSSADASGTASWFRILTQAGGTARADGTVGTSGCDINFNTVAFTAGSEIGVSAFTITLMEGP